MPVANVNGAEFYFELHGEGHPLVLIAGYSCDHLFWQPIQKKLAEQYQVLVFDNRAVGQTKDAGLPLTTELMADDTIALCSHLALDQPFIVGHSMGGAIGQVIAATYPDKMSKLGILTSSPKLADRVLDVFDDILKMREENREIDDIIEASLPWIYSDTFIQDKKKVNQLKQEIINNPHPQTLKDQIRQYQLLRGMDIRPQLASIQSPTLIVCGSQDAVSPVAESVWMSKQIELSQLVELDSGHGIVREKPEQIVEVIRRFF